MKATISQFTILFAIPILVLSCKKDNTPLSPGDFDSSNGEDIIIGNPGNMYVKVLDITLNGEYNAPQVHSIDLDGDGKNDFKLRSEVVGSSGNSGYPRAYMHCLHNGASVFLTTVADSTFISDSTYTLDSGNQVAVIDETTYSCYQKNPTDPVISINDLKLIRPLNYGSGLSNSTSFEYENNKALIFGNVNPLLDAISTSNDTTYYEAEKHINDCHDFPQGNYEYVGIKLKVNGFDKLGWIKFRLTDDKVISIAEAAIHR